MKGFCAFSVGKDANRGGLGVTSVLFGSCCFSNTNNGGVSNNGQSLFYNKNGNTDFKKLGASIEAFKY